MNAIPNEMEFAFSANIGEWNIAMVTFSLFNIWNPRVIQEIS